MTESVTLGLCSTGFFFLSGWCWYLNTKVSGALDVSKKVDEIHLALLGDMKSEGLISKQRRMEEQCRIRHDDRNKSLACATFALLWLGLCTAVAAYVVGDSFRLVYNVSDSAGAYVANQTVGLKIQKVSNGYWYDFADSSFKDSGWTTKENNLTEDTTNGFYYWDFTPPVTEVEKEQYVLCVENDSSIYGDHQCTTVVLEAPGGDTETVLRIDKNTNGLKDVDSEYSGVEKMIQIHR